MIGKENKLHECLQSAIETSWHKFPTLGTTQIRFILDISSRLRLGLVSRGSGCIFAIYTSKPWYILHIYIYIMAGKNLRIFWSFECYETIRGCTSASKLRLGFTHAHWLDKCYFFLASLLWLPQENLQQFAQTFGNGLKKFLIRQKWSVNCVQRQLPIEEGQQLVGCFGNCRIRRRHCLVFSSRTQMKIDGLYQKMEQHQHSSFESKLLVLADLTFE